MTDERSDAISFGIILSAGVAVATIIGWQAVAGFILGAITVVVAAILCDLSFEEE